MWNTKVIGVAALSFIAMASCPASAQEKLVGTYGEVRTVLAYKVSDAALQKFIPAGWQSNPLSSGPSAGANMIVTLVDQLSVQDPDGKPQDNLQIAALVLPAKKTGTDATVSMVFGGFASHSSYVPGAYGNFELAKATVERKRRAEPGGKSSTEESWDFKADNGSSISIQLQYAPAPAARTKAEARVYSAKMSDFYRIYRIEQALDVVRSSATGTDRVQKIAVKVTGSNLDQLLDGTEKLVSITSIPWYTRQVFLPSGGTQ
jgi:hypothetical protein